MAPQNSAMARALPFAIYIGFLILDSLVQHFAPAIDQLWTYGLRIAAVAAALAAFRKHYVELALPSGRIGHWIAALLVGIGVFLVWINLDAPWMRLGGQGGGFNAVQENGDADPALVAMRLFGAVLVVPLVEELFWRSFLMRWIDRPAFLEQPPRRTSNKALMITSVLFALEHHEWLAGLVAGLAYAILYKRTGNIWFPIAAHAVTNLALGIWIVATHSWHYW